MLLCEHPLGRPLGAPGSLHKGCVGAVQPCLPSAEGDRGHDCGFQQLPGPPTSSAARRKKARQGIGGLILALGRWGIKPRKRRQMKKSDPRRSGGFSRPPSTWVLFPSPPATPIEVNKSSPRQFCHPRPGLLSTVGLDPSSSSTLGVAIRASRDDGRQSPSCAWDCQGQGQSHCRPCPRPGDSTAQILLTCPPSFDQLCP